MAPGLNGTGPGAGGGGGRLTGTVPKIKSRHVTGTYRQNSQQQHHINQYQLQYQQYHDQIQQHLQSAAQHSQLHSQSSGLGTVAEGSVNRIPRKLSYNNIPKNQVLLDWQMSEYQSPQKNVGSRDPAVDGYGAASDGQEPPDNQFLLPQNSPRRDGVVEMNGALELQLTPHQHRFRMNGHDFGHGTSPSPCQSEASSHYSPEVCRNAPPDRVPWHSDNSFTATDAKRNNIPRGPERAQIASRLNQIQDYIKQTSALMDTMRNSSSPGEGDKLQLESMNQLLDDLRDSEAKLQYLIAAFDKLSSEDDTKSCMTSASSETPGLSTACNQSPGCVTGAASTQGGMLLKMCDLNKQNELKLKLEESMRKLLSLQEEQTSLKHKQTQEHQLDANRQQAFLMSVSSARRGSSAAESSSECISDLGREERMRDSLLSNLQELEGQLCALNGKNQVADPDDNHSLSREHKVLELQRKKQHMDKLTADLVASYKELSAEDEVKEQASSEDSAVEDALDEYADARAQVRLQGQIVRDKVAELHALQAQLDRVKGLMTVAQKKGSAANGADNNSKGDGFTPDHSSDEQAVNIQNQRYAHEDRPSIPDRLGSKQSNATYKQQLLDQERAKLKRLHELLAKVQEYRSSGMPIPDHLLNEMNSEAYSGLSQSTSPGRTTPRTVRAVSEDAAIEADAEEDEPESAIGWSMGQMSLSDSVTFANELSQGLQQRAAELQAERDGLTATQRKLDGLFSQLKIQQEQQHNTSTGSVSSSTSSATAVQSRSRDVQPKTEEVVQRRSEMLHDLQNKWQELQREIASDSRVSVTAAPIMDATRDVMNAIAAHVLAPYEAQNQSPILDLGEASPGGGTTQSHEDQETQKHQVDPEPQTLSAPSTLTRQKHAPVYSDGQRAVWSSSAIEDDTFSPGNSGGSLRMHQETIHDLPLQDNPPIISMPSPSPNIFQQQTMEMQNRLAALSQSCQSLLSDTVEGANLGGMLPALSTAIIPPPPPPGSASHDREAYYQQLLAASQLQQQQVLLTAVNQCFHLLKLQQHELRNLSNSVHVLSTGTGHVASLPPMVVPPSSEQWAAVGVGVAQGMSPTPPSGPPTLNNQVPPGNRTNNYWDNFRSYSRQNLLSTSAKSNEGLSHSPSPLVERSHNALRSSTPTSIPGPSSAPASTSVPALIPPTYTYMHGAGSLASQSVPIADPTPPPLGATGPVHPTSLEFSGENALGPALVQNNARNDKRNLDFHEGTGTPYRRSFNERDEHHASGRTSDGAETLVHVPLDFEVPPMPILRIPLIRSLSELGAVVNDTNFNGSDPTVSHNDHSESTTRNQLNNEGVPFSEISINNQILSGANSYCSSRNREAHWGNRHNFNNASAPMTSTAGPVLEAPCTPMSQADTGPALLHFNNVTSQVESSPSVGSKCNSGAIKPTTVLQNSANNALTFTPPNYQRNFHASTSLPSQARSNASGSCGSQNLTRNLATSAFSGTSGDTDTNIKSSKNQTGQDCSRNFNVANGRFATTEDHLLLSSGGASPRSKLLAGDDLVSNPFRRSAPQESEDTPVVRGSQSLPCQNFSPFEGHSFGSGKNQLKESCFQIRKCPKYQAKSGSRGQVSGTAAAAAAVAAVAASGSSISNSQRSKSQAGNRRQMLAKNNQDSAGSSQPTQSRLFDELRDAVYAEMTSLISANESRPHFLIQLFRDLQLISSDPLRQTTLQLIHQAVARYQAESSLQSRGDGGVSSQEDEAEEDEDRNDCSIIKDWKQRLFRQEEHPSEAVSGATCNTVDLQTSSSSMPAAESLLQLILGETAVMLSAHTEDICSLSLLDNVRRTVIQQLILLRLIPPSPGTSSVSSCQTTNISRPGYFLHGQIDDMLASSLLKYQGSRVGDITEELTSTIAIVLRNKLAYFRLVDHFALNSSGVQSNSSKEAGASGAGGGTGITSSQYLHASPHAVLSRLSRHNAAEVAIASESASNGDLTEADQSHISACRSVEAASPEDDANHLVDCDVDSEADRDVAAEGSISASGSESASAPLHVHVFQLAGAPEIIDSELEAEADQEEGETANCTSVDESDSRDETLDAGAVSVSIRDGCTGNGGLAENGHDCRSKSELDEAWGVEQEQMEDREQEREREREREREQGLDRVPTRLSCDNDRDHENGEQNRSHHLPMPPSG